MALSVYLVTYKTDTNPHHPGNPLAFDTKEKAIVTTSVDAAIAYVAKQLDKEGVQYQSLTAKFYKPYTP